MLAIKNGTIQHDVGSAQLAECAKDFLLKHQVAYGSELLKPKHHWMLDIAQQVSRDRGVLDAFVIERQHLLVKQVAEHVRNLRDYERSVLASVVTVQLQRARDLVLGDRLLGATNGLCEMPNVLVSTKLQVFGFVVAAGDVILRGREAGIVVAGARDGAELFLFVEPLAKLGDATHSLRFRRSLGLAVWRPRDVRQSPAWRAEPDGSLLVLNA